MIQTKVVALTAAATIATAGLFAPAASAQSLEWDETSSQMPFADTFSSEEPLKSIGQGMFTVFGSMIWTPVVLSAMASSLLGPQCHLGDTRGCREA